MRMRDGDEIENFELIEKSCTFQRVVAEKGIGLIVQYSPIMDYSMFSSLHLTIEKWGRKMGIDPESILILPETVSVKVVRGIIKGAKSK